jgi:hypothetical protein
MIEGRPAAPADQQRAQAVGLRRNTGPRSRSPPSPMRPPMSALERIADSSQTMKGAAARHPCRRTQTSKGENRGRCGEVARQTLRGFGGCESE